MYAERYAHTPACMGEATHACGSALGTLQWPSSASHVEEHQHAEHGFILSQNHVCRLPRVASAAAAIARHWQELGGLGGVPFALPAVSSSGRPSKGFLPPSAHLMPPTGIPNAAPAAPRPAGQGTSGAKMGQDVLLQRAQDQRLSQPSGSQGGSQGSGHSEGVLAASQSTGSRDFVVRYFARSGDVTLTVSLLRDCVAMQCRALRVCDMIETVQSIIQAKTVYLKVRQRQSSLYLAFFLFSGCLCITLSAVCKVSRTLVGVG